MLYACMYVSVVEEAFKLLTPITMICLIIDFLLKEQNGCGCKFLEGMKREELNKTNFLYL